MLGLLGRSRDCGRIIPLLCLAAWPSSHLWGQSKVLVTFEDQELPVVSMQGSTPIVEVDGERFSVPDATVALDSADEYVDGSIEVLKQTAFMGQDYGSAIGGFFFRFDATMQAERDFDDCFVLFAIVPERGEPTYLIRKIPDIKAIGAERLFVTLPMNPGFGGGALGYKIFSGGMEIRTYLPDEQLSVYEMGSEGAERSASTDQNRERRATIDSDPTKAIAPRLLDYPEKLLGTGIGGYANAIYSVDREGRASELIDIKGDHGEFIPEVWKTIVETRYQPGSYDGEPLITTVKQSFFFNEFAPFSEAIEMIAYPTLSDREAVPIYLPSPSLEVTEPITVKVLATIDKLGRASQVAVLDGGESEAARAAVNAVERWVFLPAIVDGYPAEQSLQIPITFAP